MVWDFIKLPLQIATGIALAHIVTRVLSAIGIA